MLLCRFVDVRGECGRCRRQQPGILHRLLQPSGYFHSGPWLHWSLAPLETPRSVPVFDCPYWYHTRSGPYPHHMHLLLMPTTAGHRLYQVFLLPPHASPIHVALTMHTSCPVTSLLGLSVRRPFPPLPSPHASTHCPSVHCIPLLSLRAACMVQRGKGPLVGSQGMP